MPALALALGVVTAACGLERILPPECMMANKVSKPHDPVEVGDLLESTTGDWINDPVNFRYSWYRTREYPFVPVEIPGATGNSYVVQEADRTYRLSCEVIASNAGGDGPSTSDEVGPVPGPEIVEIDFTGYPSSSFATGGYPARCFVAYTRNFVLGVYFIVVTGEEAETEPDLSSYGVTHSFRIEMYEVDDVHVAGAVASALDGWELSAVATGPVVRFVNSSFGPRPDWIAVDFGLLPIVRVQPGVGTE